MVSINEQFGSIAATLGITLKWGLFILLLVVLLGVLAYWMILRQKWNIKVEFKLRRSEGHAIYSEYGKGNYKPSRGYAIVKRPGIKGRKYEIKNFDPTIYLQGNDVLTVVQVGANEFIPVIPESFQEVTDEKTGKVAALMSLKGDASKDRAWQAMRTRDSMNAFTISSFLQQNGQMIGFGLVLVVVILGLFLGFGMILDRLPQA